MKIPKKSPCFISVLLCIRHEGWASPQLLNFSRKIYLSGPQQVPWGLIRYSTPKSLPTRDTIKPMRSLLVQIKSMDKLTHIRMKLQLHTTMTVRTFITIITLRCLDPFILHFHHRTCSCSVTQQHHSNYLSFILFLCSFSLLFCFGLLLGLHRTSVLATANPKSSHFSQNRLRPNF